MVTNAIVLPHFGIPLPHGAGPRVDTKFTLFWWSGKREDAGLSEVTGLYGRKSGYLCPLVAWVHNSTKAFLSWEGLGPRVGVAGFGIC